MVTIRDVAESAGVSIATVSHVINGTRPVAESTQATVRASMVALGYRPNAVARSLRRQATTTIGMIVPDSANPFFAEMARSIEDHSFTEGYSVILCNTEGSLEREQQYADVLVENMVAGIVFVAVGPSTRLVGDLQRRGVPIVLVDREVPGVDVDTVETDHHGGGQLATQHLINLGHRRIACINGGTGATSSTQRLSGYVDTLASNGITVDPSLIRTGDYQFESGRDACRELLELPEPPTGVFACNDLMAVGCISAATAGGLSVPGDLSVVGFDDVRLASFANPPLTTISQPKHEIAAKVVELLIARMKSPTTEPQLVTFGVEMRERGSTGRVRIDGGR